MHFAATEDLVFTDNWNIILALAGDDTSRTPSATVQVDCHPPLLDVGELTACVLSLPDFDVGSGICEAGMLVCRIAAELADRLFLKCLVVILAVVGRCVRLDPHLIGEIRMLFVIVSIAFTDNRAALHRPMLLCIGQLMRLRPQLECRTQSNTQAVSAADGVSIETNALPYAADDFPPHSERQDDGVIGHTGNNVDGALDLTAIQSEFGDDSLLLTTFEFRLVGLQCALRTFEEGAVFVHRLLGGEDLDAILLFEFFG